MQDNRENPIVLNSVQTLEKAGFPADSIERFVDDAVSLLDDYAERFPRDYQFLGDHAGVAWYANKLCRYVRGLQNADSEL